MQRPLLFNIDILYNHQSELETFQFIPLSMHAQVTRCDTNGSQSSDINLVFRPSSPSEHSLQVTKEVTPILKQKIMPKLSVTDFSKRNGSPFQDRTSPEETLNHEEVLQKTYFEKQKEKQSALIEKVNIKTADVKSNKIARSDGCFTEVVTHGAFTSKTANKRLPTKSPTPAVKPTNGSNGSKSPLLGYPSSANDLALDAKTDLESDPNISAEVKEKVIEKLFALASIAQHIYESKVRLMTEFERFKDTHLKNEVRREKEHSEQLYKLNLNFQSEVIQAIQQLKSELDISGNASTEVNESGRARKDSIEFKTCNDDSSVAIESDKENVIDNSADDVNDLRSSE